MSVHKDDFNVFILWFQCSLFKPFKDFHHNYCRPWKHFIELIITLKEPNKQSKPPLKSFLMINQIWSITPFIFSHTAFVEPDVSFHQSYVSTTYIWSIPIHNKENNNIRDFEAGWKVIPFCKQLETHNLF